MSEPAWVAIIITTVLNVAGWCFSAGILYQRLRSLETTVIDGLASQISKIDQRLDRGDELIREQGEEISGINERCRVFHRDLVKQMERQAS